MPPPEGQSQTRVLVVDDDEAVLTNACSLLESMAFKVSTARNATETVRVISEIKIDLALIDWRLEATQEDGMALGRMLWRDFGIPFVIFSGYLSTDATGIAYRNGAIDVLDKPLRPERILAAVNRPRQEPNTLDDRLTRSVSCGADSVADRWAQFVLAACKSAKDPRTEQSAARAAGVSTSVYRKVCYACDVLPRDTRDFSRFLRALSRSKEDRSPLRYHLAFGDPRTLASLFERAGLPIDSRFFALQSFILSQKFIPLERKCLQLLSHRAANDRLFYAESLQQSNFRPA